MGVERRQLAGCGARATGSGQAGINAHDDFQLCELSVVKEEGKQVASYRRE